MKVPSHQIQNVIRAYGQRVERKGLNRIQNSAPQSVPDTISISYEAKYKQVTEKISSEIVARVTGQKNEENMNGISNVVEKLGAELGGQIDIMNDQKKNGSFKFRVIDPEKGEVIKELNQEDIQKVIGRLYDKIEARVV